MNCPRCASDKVVKNGHRYGKQSYLCRDCHRQFRENPSPQGYSAEVKDICIKMSLNGMGFRGIERVTGINRNSVINALSPSRSGAPKRRLRLRDTRNGSSG